MTQEITDIINTYEDVLMFRDEILKLKSVLYKTDTTQFDTVLQTQVRKHTADYIGLLLTKNSVNREYFLKELENQLDRLKPVTITIAFEPTECFVQKIVTFVRKHISTNSVISICIDHKIIGGAIVSFDGYYKDFSVSKQLDRESDKFKA